MEDTAETLSGGEQLTKLRQEVEGLDQGNKVLGDTVRELNRHSNPENKQAIIEKLIG